MSFDSRNDTYWQKRADACGKLEGSYADFEHRQYLVEAARRAALPISVWFGKQTCRWFLFHDGKSMGKFTTASAATAAYLALCTRLMEEQS